MIGVLQRVVESMRLAAAEAGRLDRGRATPRWSSAARPMGCSSIRAGVGLMPEGSQLAGTGRQPGDVVLVSARSASTGSPS